MKIRIKKTRCGQGLPWWTVTRDERLVAWVGSFERARMIAVGLVNGRHVPGLIWLPPGVQPSPGACARRAMEIADATRVAPISYLHRRKA